MKHQKLIINLLLNSLKKLFFILFLFISIQLFSQEIIPKRINLMLGEKAEIPLNLVYGNPAIAWTESGMPANCILDNTTGNLSIEAVDLDCSPSFTWTFSVSHLELPFNNTTGTTDQDIKFCKRENICFPPHRGVPYNTSPPTIDGNIKNDLG
ncbi:MAG: hypothetical protein ABFS35_10015, partial [Bacteroidota bacterium]